MNLYKSLQSKLIESSESLPDDLLSYLTDTELKEAPNPENAEANELIRKSLADWDVAIKNEKELSKYGISLDINKNQDTIYGVNLVGKNGRKLVAHRGMWHSTPENIEYDQPYDGDYKDATLYQKSYTKSRSEYKDAVEELPRLKKRLNLYNRRYGEDSERTKELKDEIKKAQKIVDDGIQVQQAVKKNQWGGLDHTRAIHPDADLKGYLDSTKVKDREYDDNLVYTRGDSYYNGKNKEVSKYEHMKSQEAYNKRQAEENKRRDAEDEERLERYRKSFAEEKANRDEYLQKDIDETRKERDAFNKRLEDFRAKRGIKDSEELNETTLPSATELFDQVDAIVPATLIEDEDGITIELLDGTFKADETSVTFDAPWLPINSRPMKFTSTVEFVACLEMMTSIFSNNKK